MTENLIMVGKMKKPPAQNRQIAEENDSSERSEKAVEFFFDCFSFFGHWMIQGQPTSFPRTTGISCSKAALAQSMIP